MLSVFAHRSPPVSHLCFDRAGRVSSVQQGEIMKHNAYRSRQITELPIAWREAEYAALRLNAADTCDDRVTEDIYDVDDERAELDIISRRMTHDAN